MRDTTVCAFGTVYDIFRANKGDKLLWHSHSLQDYRHGHFVIQGRTLVEVKGEEPRERTPNDPNLELDKDKFHQVTVLEDDTIFSHRRVVSEKSNVLVGT